MKIYKVVQRVSFHLSLFCLCSQLFLYSGSFSTYFKIIKNLLSKIQDRIFNISPQNMNISHLYPLFQTPLRKRMMCSLSTCPSFPFIFLTQYNLVLASTTLLTQHCKVFHPWLLTVNSAQTSVLIMLGYLG